MGNRKDKKHKKTECRQYIEKVTFCLRDITYSSVKIHRDSIATHFVWERCSTKVFS